MYRITALLIILISLGPIAMTQTENPVAISFAEKGMKVKAGEKFHLHLLLTIKPTWHINSHQPKDETLIPTVVTASGTELKLSGVQYPEAKTVRLPFSDEPLSVYEGSVTFVLTLAVDSASKPGPTKITVGLHYQSCNDATCLPPATETATMALAIAPGVTNPPAQKPGESKKELSVTQDAQKVGPEKKPSLALAEKVESGISRDEGALSSTFEKSGLLVSLLLIFVGGLALNLTPCVYPLIPITIGYFGGQSEGKTSRLFLLGLLYMLGMALTYSIIGVVTSLSGAIFGALLQNVYVIVGIAMLFVILSLSQFGVYEFSLPSSWMSAAGGAKGGAFGAFFMGLTMGIVAAPCIGPFVLGLVTYVASKGDPFQGFLMFFVLAVGLGLPYLFLALFSGKIKNLPRSGEWMEGVKHLFGFLLLGMAFYFLGPILPKPVGSTVLPVFGVVAAVILLFVDRKGNGVRGFRISKSVFAVAALVVSVFALIPTQKHSPDWKNFTVPAYEGSLRNHERMIIDFYADWCIPCKELDASTFSHPAVVDESRRFTAYKVDMTQSLSAATDSLGKQFQIKGVPTVLIIDSQGKEVDRITGFLTPEEFLKRIQKVL